MARGKRHGNKFMNISHRLVNLGVFVFTAAMMLIAYFYFQKYLGLLPCPLCVSQRIFAILAGVFALVAFLHNPPGYGKRVYAVATALAAIGGAIISGRQVWLQSLPEDQVPACGPTLGYLYEYFPLQDVLNAMFIGEGSCAEVLWSFMGLSIPGWTLVAFISIILVSIWQLFRKAN